MHLLPFNADTEEKLLQAKRAGGVKASYSDMAEIFAKNYLRSKGFFFNNNLDQVSTGQIQLPLLTYPFLDYLTTLNLEDRSLTELGSGNSTLFFSKIFNQVTSYETNEKWITQLREKIDKNVKLNLISTEELELASFDIHELDIILVDFAGKRTKFIYNYFSKTTKKAPIIFFDNTDMYRNGVEILKENGYTEIPFYGFKSGQTWISCTSVFILGVDNGIVSNKYINTEYTKNGHTNGWDTID